MHPSKRFQSMRPSFAPPVPLSLAYPPHSNVSTLRPPRMAIDPNTVGTGYALLNHLKGVVIGPTINEITAAIAGGTVGVMGTIITLEVRRQRAKERQQCPYCRGTGILPCGRCYTLGAVPSGHSLTAQEECSACLSKGYLQCNHVSRPCCLAPLHPFPHFPFSVS